jgi:hypothetical protein
MKNMMQNVAFNNAGYGSTLLAIGFSTLEWFGKVQFNHILTVVISALSIVFISMKIYDQYLITKERKNKNK